MTSGEPVAFSWGNETGHEEYHWQMYGDRGESGDAWTRYKILTTGLNVARKHVAARNRGRADWIVRHGSDPDAWPMPHPPGVVWIPERFAAVCLRCLWLDYHAPFHADAEHSAREHARSFLPAGSPSGLLLPEPLPVWQVSTEV